MDNLPYVKNDLLNTRATAQMMKMSETNIIELIDCNFEKLTKFFEAFSYLIKAYTQELTDKTKLCSMKVLSSDGMTWDKIKKFAMKPGYSADKLSVSSVRCLSHF